jgi:hypothetical protein
MTPEEAGRVILDIFRAKCKKAGDSLPTNVVHKEYFRKTGSALGFEGGIGWLFRHHCLAPSSKPNVNEITEVGLTHDAG